MRIRIDLNGESKDLDADPLARLLDVLRIDLGLTGTKEGCGEGECGACTVLIDGLPVNACLVPVAQVDGHAVDTVEGLADGTALTALQQALIEHNGTQCGICTPGIVMTATAAIAREPGASRERLREVLAGNLCRCTGYQRVIDAVEAAQQRLVAAAGGATGGGGGEGRTGGKR